MTVLEKFLCGSAAGTLSMTMVYPMYVIQNRMLVAPEGHYKGLIDCVRQTVKHEGFKALTQVCLLTWTPCTVCFVLMKTISSHGLMG